MNWMTTPRTRLQSLAARWCVWAQVLIALARRVSMSHKQMAHGGAAEAEMVEAQLYVALVQVSADISHYAARKKHLSRADKQALAYLHKVRTMLSIVALLVRQLRADLQAMAETLKALRGCAMEERRAAETRLHERPWYIDTS